MSDETTVSEVLYGVLTEPGHLEITMDQNSSVTVTKVAADGRRRSATMTIVQWCEGPAFNGMTDRSLKFLLRGLYPP